MSEDVPYILRLFLTFFKMFTLEDVRNADKRLWVNYASGSVAFLKLLNEILTVQLNYSISREDALHSSRFLLNAKYSCL